MEMEQRLNVLPVRVYDLEQIRLEHVLVQDLQVVGDEVVCLQGGSVLIHLGEEIRGISGGSRMKGQRGRKENM